MQARQVMPRLKYAFNRIDWELLLFLVLFLNVKLIIKVIALAFQYLIRPDFKFGFRLKSSPLPIFYPLMIFIGILNTIMYTGYKDHHYLMSIATGISFWLMCILAIHQLKKITESKDPQRIYFTLITFFLINFSISLIILLKIIIETGSINPYQYQGLYQKYFINTGDYIKGVTFDTSTTNAAINALGIVYFFFRKNNFMVFVCMFTLLITGSNLINLLLFAVFGYLFVFRSNANQKSIMLSCFMMLIVFLGKVSPQNYSYLTGTLNSVVLHKDDPATPVVLPKRIQDLPDSVLDPEQRKQKTALLYLDSIGTLRYLKELAAHQIEVYGGKSLIVKPEIPHDNIHTPPFQHKDDTTSAEQELRKFMAIHQKSIPNIETSPKIPGKIIAFQQSFAYLAYNPGYIFTGTGIGRFSSKLAFRTSGLSLAGGYPQKFTYIDPAFLQNHLGLYLNFFARQEKMHSITNTPFSVYDQILTEYGLAGFVAFLLFYLGYFFKKSRHNDYGIPMIMLLIGLLFIDYWFEQLSVIDLFDLMMLHNKENIRTL